MCFGSPKLPKPSPTPPPVTTKAAEVTQAGRMASARQKRIRSIFAGESSTKQKLG